MAEVFSTMTVWTECVRVVYRIVAASRQRDFVMYFKVWRSIAQACERRQRVAELALSCGAMKYLHDHIRVSLECTRDNLNFDWLLGRKC